MSLLHRKIPKKRGIFCIVCACILILLALMGLIVGLVLGLRKSPTTNHNANTTSNNITTPITPTTTISITKNPRLKLTLDHGDKIEALKSLGYNGLLASTGSNDALIKIWNTKSLSSNPIRTLVGHQSRVTSLAWLGKYSLIASASLDTTIKIWNITNGGGEMIKSFKANGSISVLEFMPSQSYLASGGYDAAITIWDMTRLDLAFYLLGHTDRVTTLVSIGGGLEGLLASGSDDSTVKIWNVLEQKLLFNFVGHTGKITCLTYLGNSLLASGSEDAAIKIWNLTTGFVSRTFTGHTRRITSLVSLGDALVVTGSEDSTLKIWDFLNTKTAKYTFNHNNASVLSVATLTLGENILLSGYVVSGTVDGAVRVWNSTNGALTHLFDKQTSQGHTLNVTRIESLGVDNLIATGSNDNTIKVWDLS
jgi:WD40 repeat protein